MNEALTLVTDYEEMANGIARAFGLLALAVKGIVAVVAWIVAIV